MSGKIKIKDVAEVLGVTPSTIHYALQTGSLPFGVAIKRPDKKKYSYIIFPEKYAEYVEGHGLRKTPAEADEDENSGSTELC